MVDIAAVMMLWGRAGVAVGADAPRALCLRAGPVYVRTNSATNVRVLAWLPGRESLHNNHHAYPASPKFSMGCFEFDPSWVVIRVVMLLRVAPLVGEKVKLAA